MFLEPKPAKMSTNRLTLRLPVDILEYLKEEADKKNIPINAVVTKIISSKMTFDMSVGLLPNANLPCLLVSKMLDKLDDASLKELAAEGPNLIRNMFAIEGVPYELENVIAKHFAMLGKYCNWYEFTSQVNKPYYRLVFKTRFGANWASFVFLYVRTILLSLKVHIDMESSNGDIIFFELRN